MDNIATGILSDITFHMKYARYLPDKERRETWEETVTRNKEMHLRKFAHVEGLAEEIEKAYELVYQKKVLPSGRSLQFAGKPIEISPQRLYNCSAIAVDDPAVFSEVMFLLLSGTGCGLSLQKFQVKKLPPIMGPMQTAEKHGRNKRYLVADSIEGWASAVRTLMSVYFEGKRDIEFDYRDIRPKGARLVTAGGKAPGPQPLKDCLHNIRKVLDASITERGRNTKLKPIECYDILCHIADAVLAGGIRRSALISIFSYDDEEMMTSKYGDWWEKNPHRGRSNNSVMLLRHKVKEEDFFALWEKIKASGTGDPAFIFSNERSWATNPCLADWNLLLVEGGDFKKLKDIKIGDRIWSKEGWTTVINKWSTGIKPVYRYDVHGERWDHVLYATENHRVVVGGEKIEVQDAYLIDCFDNKQDRTETYTSELVHSELVGNYEVFDITVDNESHTFYCGGCDVSNCGEVALRSSGQFCNLTTMNVGNIESQEDLNERARVASFIGTLQASYTSFHFLRDVWQETTEKEYLLGVSMTGVASGNVLKYDIKEAAGIVLKENERVAKRVGIEKSARATTLKPEGSSSLVLGTSSGVHAWYAPYYKRRIRVGKNESIYTYLKIYHPELLEDDFFTPTVQAIIVVPVKAPEGSIYRTENTLDLLERVKRLNVEWIRAGHRKGSNYNNVSVTVNCEPEDWDKVGNWMWTNREFYNGISVFPADHGSHKQAPFEECSKEEYERLIVSLKEVDLSKVIEMTDETTMREEIACGGADGACEVK